MGTSCKRSDLWDLWVDKRLLELVVCILGNHYLDNN